MCCFPCIWDCNIVYINQPTIQHDLILDSILLLYCYFTHILDGFTHLTVLVVKNICESISQMTFRPSWVTAYSVIWK